MHFIEDLKIRPNHVKSRVALLVAVSFTGIIGLVWISTIPARFSDTATSVPKETDKDVASVTNAFDEIIAGTKKGIDSMQVEETVEETLEEETPPTEIYMSDSALGKLSNWSATTSTPEAVETIPLPSQETIIAPTPTPTPTPVPIPVSVPPVVSPPIGGKETIGGTGETKASVILIGTTTKKTE